MTSDEDVLSRVETESALLLAATGDAAPLIYRWREAGLTVRHLRGRKTRTLSGLYDEAAAALQFPSYFGENLDALNECLTDLPEWIEPGRGIVLVVTEAEQFLRDEPLGRAAFLDIVANVQRELSHPIQSAEWWDRAAVPFHVVLVCREGEERNMRSLWNVPGDRSLHLE